MKPRNFASSLLLLFFLMVSQAEASGYHVSGRILKPDDTPFDNSAVSFLLSVTSPDGQCTLYREQIINVNLAETKGRFSLSLGSGTRVFPTSPVATVEAVFSNKSLLNCEGGTTYTPALSDERLLKVSFFDGANWQSFSPDHVIKAVPYSTEAKEAQNASQVSGYTAPNLLRVDGGTVPSLTVAEATQLMNLANGSSSAYLKNETDPTVAAFAKQPLPACSNGNILTANGSTLSCVPAPAAASPLPTGTANQFLKYDGANWISSEITIGNITGLATSLNNKIDVSQMPASCGANQTLGFVSVTNTWQCNNININLSGDVTGATGATTVTRIQGVLVDTVAPSTGQVLKYDGAKWKAAADTTNAGTVVSVAAGTGLTGGTITNSGTLSLANTSVTPATYGGATMVPTITVDQQGRITAASNTSISFPTSLPPNGTASGDLGGTYPSPTVAKIQGKMVDVSAGYADGDSLVFDGANQKWVLRKRGCDSGWLLVDRGSQFCIKRLGMTGNFTQTLDNCSANKGDLCSAGQIINACKNGKMTVGEMTFINAVFGGATATAISCDTVGGAYGVNEYTITNTYMQYCCRPVNNN
ncbi:hypothetical protein QJS83_00255 [Bdellovibrio sp. 22V]|uniref:hypothetical protein n=1 Tax=Bdellovibrio sp. 22V TaxID=3044166 RepID=UPI00254353AB|nr:hypothetical protein [Bdellovibrio sp. 22V]WII72297.1 hypothetical protein QJS83_00255 [Bdellovibrio sp. 22V]